LWLLLGKNIVSPTQARTIIHRLVNETVFDLLNLRQGNFIFEQGSTLIPQLTTLEIAPTLNKILKQVQQWKRLYPHIQSADQFPVLTDIVGLRSSLPSTTINKLQHWTDEKISLRQLARYLNQDILTVAKAIYPYVQQGWVQLAYPVTSDTEKHIENGDFGCVEKKGVRIVCIDDGKSFTETVKSILQQQGYEAIALNNPLEALGLVFQIKPDLILCDIAMPELDGYEICSMLRQSTAFRRLPIIMLTGKGGFIDQTKARMVGATDYLTKPFGHNELLILVEKYLNYGF
jgi:twitching motility two-component system response regulator PilG